MDKEKSKEIQKETEKIMDKKIERELIGAKNLKVKIFFIIAIFFIVLLLSFFLGRYSTSPGYLIKAFFSHFFSADSSQSKIEIVLFNIRIPRIFVVILVGGALSVSGAAYQGMFRNPLVSPDLLGASAGASLGACLALLLNFGSVVIQISAFIFGILAVGLVILLNRIVRVDAILGFILGGIMIGTLFQSGMSIIKLVADADDKLPSITFWLMGSFSGIILKDLLLVLPPMILGFILIGTQYHKLNALSFGEEEAKTLGINTSSTRLIVIIGATLLTAASVSIAGVIGFVGLIVPHLTRAIFGPNFRILLPTSIVIGSTFLLIVDNFARLIFAIEIPIGILTSIIGVPFFILIYAKNIRGW